MTHDENTASDAHRTRSDDETRKTELAYVSWENVDTMIASLALQIVLHDQPRRISSIYGIPSGGSTVAALLKARLWSAYSRFYRLLDKPPPFNDNGRVLIVDDVIDSGKTIRPFLQDDFPVAVLYKRDLAPAILAESLIAPKLTAFFAQTLPPYYVTFPWEKTSTTGGPEDAVRRLLQYIGRDPDDPAVVDTPRRVLAWLHEFRESQDIPRMATFDEELYDGMIVVKRIAFTSICEHHLLPFTGYATCAYIPTTVGVLGLSKIARIVQYEAARTQTQERLTHNIAATISVEAQTASVAVLIEAEHMCMSLRGPKVPEARTTTSKLLGAFFDEPSARSEFMELAK